MPLPLLEIRNATKIYSSSGFMGRNAKSVVALDNFNMTINAEPATITTVAGESGSGKTTLANLMLGFIRLSEGQIIYNGRDVTNMTDEQLKLYRRNVQAVFQDPFGVYNPFYRIDHVFKTVNKHFDLSDNETEFRQMVEEGLNVVGLYGEDVLRKYPHQLSGGQRQRIMMARAYMIKPRLIVADEPVSMVDASLRASILDAMLRLRDEHNISFLYITHDLSTAYQIGDQIYMLYQGTIAERGRTLDVIDRPQHPYVQLLIDSVPVPDPTEKWDVDISLPSEEEMRTAHAKGCRYYPRCPHRMDKCLVAQPPLYQVGNHGQEASCYLYDEQPIAPLLEPVVIREDEIAVVGGSRRPLVAVIGAILIAGAALALLSSNGQEAVVEDVPTEEAATEVEPTDTDDTEASAANDTNEDDADLPFVITLDDATEKGVLELDTIIIDEITEETDKHSYTFEGTAGQTVLFKVNAEGSAFTSPYGFVYDSDGELVTAIGDISGRATRSYRTEQMLDADGTYTIVVGPNDGNGIEDYAVVVESVEVEESADTDAETETVEAEPTLSPNLTDPSLALTMDDATEKGALELDTAIIDEITEETEKHSYTFEGTAGQTVLFKVNAEGSAFTSPYGFLYDPDGDYVVAIGDVTERATRSYRIEQTLEADGLYTIVVGPYDGNGVEDYAVIVESVESEEPVEQPTTEAEEDDSAAAEPEPTLDPVLTDPSLALTMDDATEKVALELDTPVIDEITEETEKHSYTFEGTAGQTVLFKVNAEGSAFTSPYGFVYNPDGDYVVAIGDVTARATRSYRIEQTLEADGTYTIVVGSYDGNGVEAYAVTVETVESE